MGVPLWAQLGRCFPHPENICRARGCSGTDPGCFAGPAGTRRPATSAHPSSPGRLLRPLRCRAPCPHPCERCTQSWPPRQRSGSGDKRHLHRQSSGGCKACSKVGMVHRPSPRGHGGDSSVCFFLCHIWPLNCTAASKAALSCLPYKA